MSYYTWHDLDHDGKGEVTEKINQYIEEHEDLNDAVGKKQDNVKWYDHDDDMLEMSRHFPDVTFILTGEGEETDYWKTKYKDGKMASVSGSIVYPDFPELK